MPLWAIITTIASTSLVLAGLGYAGWIAWRSFERRSLMQILVRTEAVETAAQALSEVFIRLSHADDDELQAFASDIESPERRALYEVGLKSEIVTDELDRMRLPRPLVSVAEAVADAAYLITQQSRVIRESDLGESALERLGDIQLKSVNAYVAQARRRVHESCVECGLEETNVYGGGLYL